jgi:hypothetical protein
MPPEKQIGLPAQEGRDLQAIDDLAARRAVLALVHVGEHGEAELLLHLGEHGEPFVESAAAERSAGRAVGLVVAALEHQRHAEFGADALQGLRVAQGVVAALDHAGSGDQCERLAGAEHDVADTDFAGAHLWGHRSHATHQLRRVLSSLGGSRRRSGWPQREAAGRHRGQPRSSRPARSRGGQPGGHAHKRKAGADLGDGAAGTTGR